MDPIIEKTFIFLDELDKSDLMQEYRKYKNLLLNDEKLLQEISKSKDIDNDLDLISLKKEIYKNTNYQRYMELYDELHFLIRSINKKYKTFLGDKKCI